MVFAILPGHTPKEGPAANEGGPGTATPVAPNTDKTGRSANRRVVLIVLS